MAVPLARTPPLRHGLVASASKVTEGGPESAIAKRRQESWQKQAFIYTKLVPELNYASRFYAKMLAKIKLFPAFRNPDDSLTPIKEGPPVDLLDRIQDPAGGRSQILYMYGRLMFITGEGYLFGRYLGAEKEAWAFVNSQELVFEDGRLVAWKPRRDGDPIKFPAGQAEAYRMWTADPEHSGDAESPMRAVLEIAEEMDLLTRSVKSTAVSRLLNGMYRVPTEMSFGSDEPGMDDDPEKNPFMEAMFSHMLTVIENAGSPEAALGFFAEGPYEFLDRLEHINLHDAANDYMEQALRKEAVDRMGMGLDLPPEILKGMAEANHWGARQILHDTWRSHGTVIAEQACDDFCDAYLRPALREGEEPFPRWNEVVIGYDDSAVIVPPDRTDDADKAMDRGEITDEGYLKLKNIPSEWGAKEEDKRVYLAIKLRDVRLLKGTKYEVEPTPIAQPQGDMPPGPQPSTDAPTPPEETPPTPGPGGTSRQESRASAIQGAAWTAVYRSRELAGQRTRRQFGRLEELEPFVDSKAADLCACIGWETLKRLGSFEPLRLVKGGADLFVIYLTDEWGFTEAQANALAEMLVVHAARTLFDKDGSALPSGFLAQVERMQDTSSMLSEKALVDRNNEALAEVEREIKRTRGGPRAVRVGD